MSLTYPGPTFNEFTLSLPVAATEVVEACAQVDLLPGVPLSRYDASRPNELLVAVTEVHSKP